MMCFSKSKSPKSIASESGIHHASATPIIVARSCRPTASCPAAQHVLGLHDAAAPGTDLQVNIRGIFVVAGTWRKLTRLSMTSLLRRGMHGEVRRRLWEELTTGAGDRDGNGLTTILRRGKNLEEISVSFHVGSEQRESIYILRLT